MIKSNELRIGNIVNHIYDTIQIESVSGDGVNLSAADMGGGPYIEEIDCKDIEPIPLTSEWLEKFGFVESKSYDSKQRNFRKEGFDQLADYGGQIIILPEVGFASLSCGYYENQIDCPYVHQLQNLYFALTGEELTIKETA